VHFKTKNSRKALLHNNMFMNINTYTLLTSLYICSEVLQYSDGLSNKVSNIIRRLMDNIKLLLICILLLSHFFIFFRFYF